MDEQNLISAVAVHRSLYDPSHIKYKDVELRNAVWQQIADDLKMEVETCKAKWRTLRDGFTRSLRQQRSMKNIQAKKRWRYQTEMEFLMPFIYTRESRSNRPEQETEDDQDSSIKTNSPSDCGDAPADNDDALSVTSSTTPGTEPPLLLPVNLISASQDPSGLKRKFELVDFESVEYWNCRRQETDVFVKEREMNCPRQAHCQCRCSADDPTEAFFFSMGQSVKRLPFYLQAQVKMKVCQLVTDAEMECLDSASMR